MGDQILIIGAGMGGLFSALALASTGWTVTVLERDPPPPPGDADVAFETWNHRGVGHLRHSHAFLARLRSIIVSRYPSLMEELKDAGCQELTFAAGLPEVTAERYKPIPSDADLAILTSRRTTLELVLRRHVEAQPGVTFRSGVNVAGLTGAKDAEGRFVCTGLTLDDGETLSGLVVDAAGKSTGLFDWLAEMGIVPPEETEDAGILYYTRHWRLRPGQEPPPRGATPGAGDLGYIKYGVFPADNDCFSITLAAPEIEEELRKAIMRPEVFDGLCARLPGAAVWTDPARSEPISKVFGMGDLRSRWRNMTPGGKPLALGVFSVGDGLVRTNPLYGRGCSFAAIEGHLLADVLNAETDPIARALRYQAAIDHDLRHFYEDMRSQDRAAIRRARHALNPAYKPGFKAKVMKSFTEDAIGVAIRSDPALFRAFMRGFHMLEPSRAWMQKPAVLLKILLTWMTPRAAKTRFYPPTLGPERSEMLQALGVSPTADAARLGYA
jgi:2-polyprenyl-6-methoxyphenol hydroxylase-like FAD-dependent oxidoreductase